MWLLLEGQPLSFYFLNYFDLVMSLAATSIVDSHELLSSATFAPASWKEWSPPSTVGWAL
jgi:hypothetical protein